MGEVVQLQFGQCGNQVGLQFWKTLLKQHSINPQGMPLSNDPRLQKGASVFFHQAQSGRYVPRSVMVDLESGPLDAVRNSQYGRLFEPESFRQGSQSSQCNWAIAHYALEPSFYEEIEEGVRREVERCDHFSGFQQVFGLAGGTGSGLATKISSKLKECYSSRTQTTFNIYPSKKSTHSVIEPYNTVLAVHQLIEISCLDVYLDNQALFRQSYRQYGKMSPKFQDTNKIIAEAMCRCSGSLRFPGVLNTSIRKQIMNLVPFPRLHFTNCSLTKQSFGSTQTLVSKAFSQQSMLNSIEPSNGRFLTASAMFSGNVASSEAEQAVNRYQGQMSQSFVPWIVDHTHISYEGRDVQHNQALTLLSNTTAISQLLKFHSDNYCSMLRRRAFAHYYTQVGLDSYQMEQAEVNINDLISEYQQYEDDTHESWGSFQESDY